jgi:hypothetical protein
LLDRLRVGSLSGAGPPNERCAPSRDPLPFASPSRPRRRVALSLSMLTRTLGGEYQAENLPVAKKRLAQAGFRLAWVLNTAFLDK